MTYFSTSKALMFYDSILLFVKENKKNIVLFVLLSVICLFPNLFYIYFGSSLDGKIIKKIIFLGISVICFLTPFLLFNIRTSFLINGIFVLLAPIEITEIYLNKQTISPGFIMLILQTDSHEAFELLGSVKHLLLGSLLLYIVYFFCIWQLPKGRALFTLKRKFIASALGLFFLSALYANFFALGSKLESKTKARVAFANGSFSQKFEEIYPCDMILAVVGGIKMFHSINQTSAAVEHFSFGAKQVVKTNEREIYVLVIGETARYANFSINNYPRITSPLLSKTSNLISFKDVYSEANETRTALPILLTRATAQNFKVFTKEKSIIDAFDEAGFSTYWIANQSVGNDFIQRVVKKTKEHFFVTKESDSSDNLDEKLWIYLDKVLAKNERRQFIVIHTMGSHYRYDNRYSKKFKKFQPDSENSFGYGLIDKRNKDKQINSYDNSILYTDYFLANTIARINKKGAVSSLLYISDHGENLFENGQVLHGSVTPTISEVHIPLFVWTSDKYNHSFPQKKTNIIGNTNKSVTSSVVFYSLLDLANIEIRENKFQKSICSSLFHADSQRFVLNQNQQVIDMSK